MTYLPCPPDSDGDLLILKILHDLNIVQYHNSQDNILRVMQDFWYPP